MQRNLIRAFFVGAAFVLSTGANAPAETMATPVIVAQTTPAPTPKATPTPEPITYSGFIRSYYFTRLNNPQYTTKNPLNQATWNSAVSLHAQYNFAASWSIGGTYLYADPLNGTCNTPASHLAGPPCVKKNTGSLLQGTNPDDTLPGFRLSTLYEAYLQYKDPSFYAKIGDQVLTLPWAPSSDTRLKPAAYQGGDLTYAFDKNWSIEAAYMDKWESRVDSNFLNSTLLTATNIADTPGAGSNLHIAPFSAITTPGFYYGGLNYTKGPIVSSLTDYTYVNIANALWFTGAYNFPGANKPILAVQIGNQTNTGSSVIGKINSQVFGVQGTISPWSNVTFSVGYDYVPMKTDTITLPAGVTCPITTIGGTAVFPYFLPSGGTPQCHNNTNGTTTVYYGGWASPYTDSYATDPLFTTSISQGMADRRSPGQSVKVAATAYAYQKRIRFIASRAYYDYGNATGGVAPTQETDIDGTFFFNKVGKGPYKGLSFRYRYAERTQNFFTTNPDFKYNRAQLEYDF